MKSFTHIHSSSKFNRSPASVGRAAARYNSDAELVTYTEVEFEDRESAVRKANGDAFGFVSGDESNHNDAAISYKNDEFRLLYKEMFKATELEVAGKEPLYATIAVFEHRATKNALVVAVMHLSSSVEGDLAKNNSTARTLQWLSAFRNTKKKVNTLRKTFKAKACMLVADWNINFKKAWAKALVKTIAPSYNITWKNVNLPGGTHGKRIIDATLIRGSLKVKGSAELYEDDDSSDHRPFKEELVWDLTSKR